MPIVPEPVGAAEQLPFLRWVRDQLIGIEKETARQRGSDANVNSSQNSTMNMLVERLGRVQDSITGMIALATFDGSQIVSGPIAAARIPGLDGSKITTGSISVPGNIVATGYLTSTAAWSYDVGALTRRAVWMDSSGTLGYTLSSREFKKDIESWSPDEQAVLALRLVRFHWKDTDKGGHWEYGLIAEELDEIGLTWLVDYEDGKPHTVHYERLTLALIPAIQKLMADRDSHADRLNDIEARLSNLED